MFSSLLYEYYQNAVILYFAKPEFSSNLNIQYINLWKCVFVCVQAAPLLFLKVAQFLIAIKPLIA